VLTGRSLNASKSRNETPSSRTSTHSAHAIHGRNPRVTALCQQEEASAGATPSCPGRTSGNPIMRRLSCRCGVGGRRPPRTRPPHQHRHRRHAGVYHSYTKSATLCTALRAKSPESRTNGSARTGNPPGKLVRCRAPASNRALLQLTLHQLET
jgi:hypothetical protein